MPSTKCRKWPHAVDTLACLWGFAEATIFFIVPDVLLTWIALRGVRPALKTCGATLLGAMLGGTLMWICGSLDAVAARSVLDHIPAISPEMIASVHDDLATHGLRSMLLGSLIGTPYKIYAVYSGALGLNLFGFVVMSVPARLIRFVGLTIIVAWVAHLIGPRMSLRAKQRVHVILWFAFYVLFLIFMPN
ncbi:MAG: hypothetical protein IIA64_10435 [Planctomycetes bacterium]|nr:hypothetical protein [Planctomycetota bacterium]